MNDSSWRFDNQVLWLIGEPSKQLLPLLLLLIGQQTAQTPGYQALEIRF
jgi:hypothetical protein